MEFPPLLVAPFKFLGRMQGLRIIIVDAHCPADFIDNILIRRRGGPADGLVPRRRFIPGGIDVAAGKHGVRRYGRVLFRLLVPFHIRLIDFVVGVGGLHVFTDHVVGVDLFFPAFDLQA